MWKYFILGVLVGWLAQWVIDRFFWRRTADGAAASSGPPPRSQTVQAVPTVPTAPTASVQRERSGVIEPNTGATTTADTTAGRIAADVALGAPGAVSTSSATLTTNAPVYRQEDLEAIAGIGPKVGAMLRNNGITTFAELAATPAAELARIVESTGEPAVGAGLESWVGQARLAADQDWAGLASFRTRGGQAGAVGGAAGSAMNPISAPSAAAPDN